MKKRLLALATSLGLMFSSTAALPESLVWESGGIITAHAYESGTCGDNLTWSLDDYGTLTIRGNGKMTDWKSWTDETSWDEYKNKIKKVIITDGVTSVGDHAFYKCKEIISIILPTSIKSIGNSSFRECSRLESINLPEGLEYIGYNAFCDDSSLSKITLPSTVSEIYVAFGNCVNMTDIYVSKDNKTYSSIDGVLYNKNQTKLVSCPTAKKSVSIPFGVESILDSAFSGCLVKSVTFPSTLTSIGYSSFRDCTNLVSIDLPDSVKNIDDYAFQGCTKLESVSIPQTLSKLGDSVFGECYNLIKLDIPNSVRTIDKYALLNCSKINKLIIPIEVESILSNAIGYSGTRTDPLKIENFIIYCYTNTIGEQYAIDNGFDYILLPKNIDICSLTLDTSSYTYDGVEKEPTVTIKDGSKNLTIGTDYTVSYSNNVNVGTATVTITGNGNYTGTATKDFTITAKSLSSAAVTLSQTSYTYDGNAKKPTVTVKYGTKTLTNGTDYTVSYSNNVNVGTATVTVTGKGNYTGSKSVNFAITEKPKTDISKCTVTIGTTSYIYDGTAKKPSVTVKNGTTTLTNGTDYTVSYSSNTNVGTAKATITGKGNYTGTASKTFTINAKSISGMTITLSQSSYTYDGNAKKPTVTVKDGSKTLTIGTDYTVSYSNNVNVGTATVTITGNGNYTGTATKDFTITAKSLSSAAVTLSQTSYTYDGNAKKPTVTVKDGSKTLTSGTDYTVSYSNNVNVGTATVTVTGKGNYSGSKSVNFTITEKPKTDVSKCTVTLGTTSYTYDGTAKKPSVTVKNGTTALTNGTDYTVSYSSNTNAGTAKATITGKGNYTGTASKTFTINAKSISRMTITLSQSSYTYDGNAKKPTVTVKDSTKTLVNGTDYSVAYSNNVNVGTAKATVTGKGNYTGSVTKTFTIKAKPVEKKKFIEGGDNWCFSNSGSNFGSTYYMSDKYWNALLKGLSNTEKANMKKYVKKAEWGGSCYGMATTSILASNGILKPGTYQKGANFLHDISKPPSKEVKSLINYYFALQYTDVIQQQICNNFYSDDEKAKLQSLLKCLEDGSPTLLCFHGYFYGFSWGGHAVVAYDVEYGSYSYNKKAYNGKILIYDNNSVNYNDDYCLYFNSSNGSWTIPHYGLDSSDGSILGLITDDLKYVNYHGYLNGSSNVKVNDYIAVLHSAALSGNYKLTKAALSNGIWTATSASDDDIKVFSSFADTDFSKSDLMFAMKDASSGYIMKTSNTEKLDLTLSYENSLLVAEANKGKQAKFSPEGCIEVNGEKTDYTLGMTFNSDYPTEWYSIQVSGSNANNASMKKVNNGWVVSSDCLDCVIVNASNDDVEAKTIFSTKYPSALIYEIDKNTIGVKVDTDNNGTYETAINSGTETKAISKLSISLSSSSYVYDGSAKKPTITVKDSSKALVNGTDYTVSYSNNTAAGTAKVTITGKGKYTGTVTKTFTITRASLAKAKITGLSNKTYTGKAIKQTPVVKLGSKTLKARTDYTVSYKNNKAVGTATVTITGKGAYTGTAKATFKINPKKTPLKSVTSPKTKQLKATYSKVSGVTGYQVSYSTSSKFTKATTKTASSTKTSKTISKLTKGKTYYVRVRTYKTVNKVKYYSGWSAVKKIKVK